MVILDLQPGRRRWVTWKSQLKEYSRRIPKVVILLLFYFSALDGIFDVSRLEERERERERSG
jgi:hypothetical protein